MAQIYPGTTSRWIVVLLVDIVTDDFRALAAVLHVFKSHSQVLPMTSMMNPNDF